MYMRSSSDASYANYLDVRHAGWPFYAAAGITLDRSDAITVLGRRIGSLPALLVLTYRGGEVRPDHPLRAALGAIRADDSVFLRAIRNSRRQ